jgi:hypothetical protein
LPRSSQTRIIGAYERFRGYPFCDLLFSLFFMAAGFSPSVLLTPRGVRSPKQVRVLLTPRQR